MEYLVYRMDFYKGARFGEGNLDSTDMVFHADTLFSALFQEALKLEREKELLECVKNRALLFTDAFPYIGDTYFIPKPIVMMERNDSHNKGDSAEKKKYKKMKYIPAKYLTEYMNGQFPAEHLEDFKEMGRAEIKTSVGVRGYDEPSPYRVSAFYFKEGNGLYVIGTFAGKEEQQLFEELLESLSYTGLGGKKSSGLGRFAFTGEEAPPFIREGLEIKGKRNVLLSAALPEEQEMGTVLEGASYALLRRGGFVASEDYAKQMLRKRERYLFAPGSCFEKIFHGKIIEENGGNHPIFRYEQALFLGVEI